MYDDLVKRLRNRRICIQQSGSLDDFSLLAEAADAIEDLEFACNRYEKDYKDLCAYLPKWIPVTEALPEPYTWVLVSAEKHEVAFDAFYDGAQWNDAVLNGVIVTHWMPLPKAQRRSEHEAYCHDE